MADIPTPEEWNAPDKHKLPCDVWIGSMCFRQGVSLGTFVNSARRWYKQAVDAFPMNKEAAAELRRLAEGFDKQSPPAP